MSKSKVVLVVGHSNNSGGAYNEKYNLREYDVNNELALSIYAKLRDEYPDEIEPLIFYRVTYRDLPEQINDQNPDFIISLHSNAYNKKVNGNEVLYYHRSKHGKELADIIDNNFIRFLDNNNRGLKSKGSEDRGGFLLKYTDAPCVITEPYFIDNNKEVENYVLDEEGSNKLTNSLVLSIYEFHKYMKTNKKYS